MDVGTSRLTSGKERTHMVLGEAFAARSYSYDLWQSPRVFSFSVDFGQASTSFLLTFFLTFIVIDSFQNLPFK